MAKLMSKKTKEIVQTVSVLVAVILFIVFYIVFPLITVPDLAARPDKDEFEDPEFIPENDPSFFIEAGLTPDTFSLISRDNINLAGLYFTPASDDTVNGTVILVPPSDTNRTAVLSFIAPLLESGYVVVTYDQRATGYSSGVWHTGGWYEADDLVDLIADLNIHEHLFDPVIVVGFGMGGDAAMKAARDEKRIDYNILVDPYLTAYRWFEDRIEKESALGIPFANRVYYWWFKKISGFPYDRTTADDLNALNSPTTLIMPAGALESEAASKLIKISPNEHLEVKPVPGDQAALAEMIKNHVLSFEGKPESEETP